MTVTSVDIPEDLKKRIKELAAKERRSMNATMVVALEQYVDLAERRSQVRTIAREVAEDDADLLDRLAQ